MKRLFLSLCAVSCVLLAFAQPKPATVNGTTARRSKEPMKLYAITHGRIEELASSRIDTAGKFGFLFYPATEGFYVIGAGPDQVLAEKFTFYFKPGDQLNVSFPGEGVFNLQGENSKENRAIADWQQFGAGVSYPALYALRSHLTYKEFFPKFDSFVNQLPAYKPLKTGNKQFDAVFARMRKLEVLNWAIAFTSSPNSIHPTPADYISYYKGIKVEDYTQDAFLLQYPFGQRLLSFLPMGVDIIAGNKLSGDLDARIAKVANDTLRGEQVVQFAGGLKTYLGYLDLQKNYGKYILTADQQRRANEVSVKLAKESSKPGAQAINFTYPDNKGKKVSLTDFKGKVVLVDVWATWCGPCKKELPDLKKMEEEMRGLDIVFMSVSVDEEKDHQKWEDFIAKEEMKGVQLFASGWSDIAKNYDIKAIPRFMVFDKKGNIVSIDAPRPSGKELKMLLEAELKK
ncbi:TlpA disulfide reductase family protein [Paraflavitalea sp. CAU 1676]|uniref:TlpA family protein disulfide reductase n=1 Tax=Paraflavitalea sp. CAU 1676 TaxID=3032598 RepID=UPI0023DB4DB3|nr:TlpA disulfide reductase family protein [Paraflavitalea sp. CAU 1676]MDF2192830.1 TlpA disulfide reductase family protein [Paraflavitalea sp. CAU 1676]